MWEGGRKGRGRGRSTGIVSTVDLAWVRGRTQNHSSGLKPFLFLHEGSQESLLRFDN